MIPKYYKERKEKTNFEKNSSTTTFTEKKNFYMVCSIVSFPKKGRGTICLVSLLLYLQKTSLWWMQSFSFFVSSQIITFRYTIYLLWHHMIKTCQSCCWLTFFPFLVTYFFFYCLAHVIFVTSIFCILVTLVSWFCLILKYPFCLSCLAKWVSKQT